MDRLRDLHQSLRPTYIQLRTPIHPSHASAHAVTDAHGALDTEDSGFAEQAGVDALDLEGIDPIPCSQMTFRETVRLSLEFSILWFVANYFAAACLQDTSVASSTILTSTSSIWTLLIGALIGVEMFSLKKLLGVFASLAGVILISSVDIGTNHDGSRGSFPHKSRHQIAVGDVMALVSALVYGIYTTVMKKRIGDESRVSMPIFFGLIGVFNTILLWPGLLLLHYTGQETFQFPPTQRIWTIILVSRRTSPRSDRADCLKINSATSFLSDLCWAYAMLLTSPLVVTVGLSLTIPLSLVGQMIIEGYYVSTAYWVGAIIVFLTFVFINHESIVEPSSSTAIAVVNESTTQG